MSSSPRSNGPTTFVVSVAKEVQRAIEREAAKWERCGQGRSRLPLEVAAASETLASHPFVGTRWRNGYRMPLGRTGFALIYRVDEDRGIVILRTLVHGALVARAD
jgi:hypothetical protein